VSAPDGALTIPVATIEAALERALGEVALPDHLRAAVAYSLLGGGKRLRPLLAWWAAVSVGAPGESSLPGGVAVELVHAFSLVHDDLPAMDNDDLRRGKPTLHKHAGEAMAILAGDAMLNLAYQHLAMRAPAGMVGALTRELALGTTGMIAGQVFDTLGGLPAGVDGVRALETIHLNKTGALIIAACRMGGILGLASRGIADGGPALSALSAYARDIGLMFQIVDDMIDVEQPAEHTGKRTRKDSDAGKLTYPGVLGIDTSRREVERLLASSRAALAPLGDAARPLAQLASALAVRTR